MDAQQRKQGTTEDTLLSSQLLSDEDISTKGDVVFSGLDEPVKFVVVNKVPTTKEILRILSTTWQLKPPTLVISIHGSYANLKKRFTFTMKKGLWKTMESVGCWIIGDALDRGLAKIAGEAVAEYVEAYGGDTMLAIGVTPMHNLKFKHIFNTNAPIIYYPTEDDETVTDPKMTLVQKYCAKHFHLDKNYNSLVMVAPQKEKKQQVDLEEVRQTQMATRNEQLIQTRVAVERMVIGWKTAAQEKLHSSAMATSESTHCTVPTLSETTAPGQPSKQPKFRATIEPPSPPSVSLKPSKSTPSQRESGQVTPQIANLLKTPIETPSTGQKEEGLTNFLSEAGKRLSQRMSRLSTSSITHTPPSKPAESESMKAVLEKEPVAMQIPICGILAGGDRWSLHQVYASMTINHCPFVIIRGSGGAASIISNVVDFSSFMANLGEEMSEDEVNYKWNDERKLSRGIRFEMTTWSTRVPPIYSVSMIASILDEQDEQDLGAFYLRERKSPEKPIMNSARFSSSDVTPVASSRRSSHVSFMLASPKIHHQPPKARLLNLSDYMDEIIILRKMIEDLNHLVSVFDMDDNDMDGYVISALLSSAGLETPLNTLNTEQLERHGLDNFMFDAILNDQEAFVSLFVENGFDLEAFLTVHTLEKLYTASMLKRDTKLDTIRQIWETCRIYKMEWVMLRDVGRIVKHLLGEFYRPHYLSKHFRKMIKKAVAQHEAEEKEIPVTGNPWTSKKGSYFGPLSPRSSDTQKSSEGEKTPSPRTPRPSTTIIVNSLSHDSTAPNQIASYPNGKPSGIIMNGNGRYRKLGVVIPLGNENSHDSANDSNGRSIHRFLGNKPEHLVANEGDIWSRAPVVMEEDFDVDTKFIHKPRDLSRRLPLDGHDNVAYQRSKSEMSSLNEKGSTYTTDGSESKGSDEQDENRYSNTENRKGEKVDQVGAEQSTTEDPLSTTSMDDTFSVMRKTSFAGRHRGHHRLATGKLSAAERSRLISAEARRREAAKAEEKERKRRHRLAQDKRTLYERICGINGQRFVSEGNLNSGVAMDCRWVNRNIHL
ncbi:unnamed protein product [Rodentolepis nana]|uniref:LSDAT_euk domain-containing protein n=1 Tax=Rodentolepis nana TaxID=102285 RepID=A0A0R3T7I5_RODNA|nr:unnamed protein product [Rodentolepis nana]